MDVLRQTEKRYCSAAVTTAIFIGFILILAGYKPLAKGLISGTLFSILNFVIMGEVLPRRLSPSRRKAAFIAFASVILRYVLMAAPVIIAVKSPEYNVWSAIVGIFMVQLMILLDHFRNSFFSTDTRRKDALWKN